MSYVNAPVQIGATAIRDDPLSGEWSETVPGHCRQCSRCESSVRRRQA
jgi:hypothetical protein